MSGTRPAALAIAVVVASLGTAYPSIFSTIAVANTWEDAGTTQERDQITLGQGNVATVAGNAGRGSGGLSLCQVVLVSARTPACT